MVDEGHRKKCSQTRDEKVKWHRNFRGQLDGVLKFNRVLQNPAIPLLTHVHRGVPRNVSCHVLADREELRATRERTVSNKTVVRPSHEVQCHRSVCIRGAGSPRHSDTTTQPQR